MSDRSSAEGKRVYQMTDAEILRVIRGRGNELETLLVLKSLTNIFKVAAEKNPTFASGLRSAIGLTEVYGLTLCPGHENHPFKGSQASVAKCFASMATGDAVGRQVTPEKKVLVVDMETRSHMAMPFEGASHNVEVLAGVVQCGVMTPDQTKDSYNKGPTSWNTGPVVFHPPEAPGTVIVGHEREFPPVPKMQNVPRTGTGKPRKKAFSTRTRDGKPSKASLVREAMEAMPGRFRVEDLLAHLKAQGKDEDVAESVKMAVHDSFNRGHIRRVASGSYEVARTVNGEHTAAKSIP